MAVQLIRNGGFETGAMAPGWRQTPGSATFDGGITDTTTHAGRYSLRLGPMDFVEQTFSAWVCRATGELTFYAKAASAIGAGPFSVRIFYRDGTTDTPLVGRLTSRWAQKRLPVAGGKVLSKIMFSAGETDDIYIDDVSLVGSKTRRPPSSSVSEPL